MLWAERAAFCHCCWRAWPDPGARYNEPPGRCPWGCFEMYGAGSKHVSPLGAHIVPVIHQDVVLATHKLGGPVAAGLVLKDKIGEAWKDVGRKSKRASYDRGE